MFITGVLGVLKVSVSIVLHFLDLVVAVTHLMTMMMMVIEVKTNGERGKSSLLAAAVLKFREGKKKYLKTIWKRSLSTNNTKPSIKGEAKVNPTNCKKKKED